jgi:hypothetical protein
MSVTHDQLNDFHQFALAKVASGEAQSIASLADEWRLRRERDEVNQALREATNDLRAGRFRDADEVLRDLEQKHHLCGLT